MLELMESVTGGTVAYCATKGTLDFAVWVIRYRAAKRLQRKGLLYLAILREQFNR